MPVINKNKKKRNTKTPQYRKRQKVYQSDMWKEIRLAKLMEHPLCFACECEGKIELAIDVHHLITFTKAKTQNEIEALAFDSNNIVPLCKYHHWSIHHGDLKGCKSLEDIKQYIEAQKKREK